MKLTAFYFVVLFSYQALAQQQIKNYFDKVAVTGLCESGQYFNECFEKQKACQSRMRGLVPKCLKENSQLIDKKSSEISPLLSLRMGLCLGEQFEKQFQIEKKSQAKCFQADKWTFND